MTLDLSIAGLSLRLIYDLPDVFEPLQARYMPYVTAAKDAPLMTLVVSRSEEITATADLAIHLQSFDAVENRYWLDGGARGELDFVCRAGSAVLPADDPASGLEYLLRAVYAHLALRAGGVLLHAAGVLRNDRAYLFIGQSGSGKSTVAQLSRPAPILSDDLVVVLPDGQNWAAHSTPFWNPAEIMAAQQIGAAPVARIFKLVQDTRVLIAPMSLAVAAAELAANSPVVNGDPAQLPELLALCRRLADSVSVGRLHFQKDSGFWPIVSGGAP